MGAPPELAAAVSNAGGFGVLGSDGLSPEQIPQTVERTRQLTARPFGVNFIIAPLEDPDGSEEDKAEVRQLVEAAIAERVAAIVLFWGDAGPFIEAAHRNRVKVLLQVGSVQEAQTAADAGVDAVIAQGVEAGGHVRGTTPIWELLPAVVEAGSGLCPCSPQAASVTEPGLPGRSGWARRGSRWEPGSSPATRPGSIRRSERHPVESTAEDTVHGDLYDKWWPGAPHRTLRNRTYDEWEAAGADRRPGGDPARMP